MNSAPIIGFVAVVVSLILSLVLAWRRKKLLKPVLWFWALAAVVGCFAPALWTAAWHLQHGNGIQYRGKWIPVPARWIAGSEPQGATLTKLPLSILFVSRFPSSVSISPLANPEHSNPEGDVRAWEGLFRALHSGSESVVSGPAALNTASGRAYCMEFYGRQKPNRLDVSCLLSDGGLVAELMGRRADKGTFLRIVRSIR